MQHALFVGVMDGLGHVARIAGRFFAGKRPVAGQLPQRLARQVDVVLGNLEDAIVGTHLELLAHHPDSLIVRKCGIAVAEDASHRAQGVLKAGWPLSEAGQQAFAAFDAWLREDGNRRNPGTSADLVTACIFAALRDNEIGLPLSVPWSRS